MAVCSVLVHKALLTRSRFEDLNAKLALFCWREKVRHWGTAKSVNCERVIWSRQYTKQHRRLRKVVNRDQRFTSSLSGKGNAFSSVVLRPWNLVRQGLIAEIPHPTHPVGLVCTDPTVTNISSYLWCCWYSTAVKSVSVNWGNGKRCWYERARWGADTNVRPVEKKKRNKTRFNTLDVGFIKQG